jgi:hypothetical protein
MIPPHITRGRCPWCKRPIVLDDVRKVSSHQVPTCVGWDRLMAQAREELGPGAARDIGAEILPYGDGDDEPS